jgi:hypothetical protein
MSKKQLLFSTEPKEVPIETVFNGAFIKERYIKCPFLEKCCKWRLSDNHIKGYTYLNNTCYLSGSFELKCPE